MRPPSRRVQRNNAARDQSKIDAEHQSRLMALEIGEIERACSAGRAPPCLKTPGHGEPRSFAQLDEGGGSDEQRLAGEFVQTQALIFAQVAGFAAEEEARPDLRHQRCRRSDGRILLIQSGAEDMCPFGLVQQVERRHERVGNQLPVERDGEIRTVLSNGRCGGVIPARRMGLDAEQHAERRRLAVQQLIAQIE